MEHVLFLDDDHERHARFRLRMGALGHHRRYQLLYMFTAADAIAALRAHEGEIAHALTGARSERAADERATTTEEVRAV
jgi:hypothetical protein